MSADETLFVTDSEIIRRLGVPEKAARAAIQELDRHRAFPPKDPLMGNRRYWPAVRAFFDLRNGVTIGSASHAIDGADRWQGQKSRGTRRA